MTTTAAAVSVFHKATGGPTDQMTAQVTSFLSEREEGREGEGISHLRTSKLFHRSLARRRRGAATTAARWLFRWLWGIKAGELGTIARGCCCGVNWGLLESSDGELARAAPKTQKSFTENP